MAFTPRKQRSPKIAPEERVEAVEDSGAGAISEASLGSAFDFLFKVNMAVDDEKTDCENDLETK